MKSVLFISAVMAAGIYLMAQTPAGRALVAQYGSYEQISSVAEESGQQVKHWLDKVSVQGNTQLQQGSSRPASSANTSEIGSTTSTSAERAQIRDLSHRLQFLEAQVARLTQQQQGHHPAETAGDGELVVHNERQFPRQQDVDPTAFATTATADTGQGTNKTRDRQLRLQQIAQKRHKTALHGFSSQQF